MCLEEVSFLFQIQDHGSGVFQVRYPQVGETTHGGSVDDPVVGGPAHVHDVRFHYLALVVEPGQHLWRMQKKIMSL